MKRKTTIALILAILALLIVSVLATARPMVEPVTVYPSAPASGAAQPVYRALAVPVVQVAYPPPGDDEPEPTHTAEPLPTGRPDVPPPCGPVFGDCY